MRPIIITALLAWAASAQTVVSPADIPGAARSFQPQENESVLDCDLEASKPALNFGLRFQAGYLVQAPSQRDSGSGHTWRILLRITPDGGGPPVYLADHVELPPVLQPNFAYQASGAFLLGEGHYDVQLVLSDDANRICRKEWQLNAVLSREERSLKIVMPPHTAGDLSWAGPVTNLPAGPPAPRRLTVLLNSSPPYMPPTYPMLPRSPDGTRTPRVLLPQRTSPAEYRSVLIGMLASLIEKLPGTSVRLVVFDLDQQRESFRQDEFTLEEIDKAAHAANDLEHWSVDYRQIANQPGGWGLLRDLIDREAHAEAPSDVVLFLGFRTASREKMPKDILVSKPNARQRYFYLQYNLMPNSGKPGESPLDVSSQSRDVHPSPVDSLPPSSPPELPDSIEKTVERLRGKVLKVYSPADFANAVELIRRGR